MTVRTVLADIDAVGAELDEETLRGISGGMWPEYNTGSYGGNMCSWDDIAL
ncbi:MULTISPECIES: hypothetical protein [Microbispora]|uniref:hypothetical protein n=1 Tax=Microbispora TaxID=2005 RepID=UPI00140548F0|nr:MULTISPECIES: hypothetical protein [Microbispora]MBO4269190.1 hypothetical protein [Microbispora triticiradicis]GLW26214.1 hypothetical protein Mame01_62560 [Microbispora amethystogenes]